MTTLQHPGHDTGGTPGADPRAWSYGPGAWYAVLSRDAAVLLPPGERHRITALWTAVDDGVGFEALLDALLADGLRDLSGFVLLAVDGAVDGAAVRVLARGEATVSCDTDEGPVLLDGRGAATWAERRLVGVRAVRVVLDRRPAATGAEPPDATALACVVGTALVRASWVAHPALPAGAAPPITEPEPVTPAPVEPVPLPPDPARPVPAPGPGPAPEPGPDPETEPAPAGARDTDHDGGTRAGSSDGDLVARLVLSTGEVVDVDRVVLVGRDPEARPGRDPVQEPGQQPGQPRLVRVLSPQQEISSTHLEVRPGRGADLGAPVVTDLGSTNGTILVQPGLPQEDLQPWTPVPLVPGAVLDLGDGVSLQVAAP